MAHISSDGSSHTLPTTRSLPPANDLENMPYDAAGIIYNDRINAQNARAAAPAPAPATADPKPDTSATQAPTGQQALERIAQLDDPATDDLQDLPYDLAGVLYNDRIKAHHEERAAIADAAITAEEPTWDDFANLPPGLARIAFQDALQAYNENADLAELRRVREESSNLAAGLPASYSSGPSDVAEFPTGGNSNPSAPADAVRLIHELEQPDGAGLANLPYDAAGILYNDRIVGHNAQRAQLADEAIEAFAPSIEDFDHLPPGIASFAYQQALDAFNKDPAVIELYRIRSEATNAPGALPTDPARAEGSTLDVDSMSRAEQAQLLSALDIELPASPTAEDWQAARELLTAIPDEILARAINPGWQIGYDHQIGGNATTPWLPVGAGASFNVTGQLEMSNVETDADFNQSQTIRFELEMTGEANAGYGRRNALQQIYGAYESLANSGRLSDAAMRLVNSSPILRTVAGTGRILPISFNVGVYGGTRLTYESAMSPEQAQRLANEEMTAPNPLDPLSMQEGDSILIRGQSIQGSTFEVSYKLFRMDSDDARLEGLGFGVERLDGDRVRVVAGPVETVESDLFLGAGRFGISAGVQTERSLEGQQFRTAEIDLSTAEGRELYQHFLLTGSVPTGTHPSVDRSGQAHTVEATDTARAEVNLGPLYMGAELSDAKFTESRIDFDDGSTEFDRTVRLDNRTLDYNFTTDADGQIISDRTVYQFILPNNPGGGTNALDAAYHPNADDRSIDGENHVRLAFTAGELLELRELAQQQLVDYRFNGQVTEYSDALSAETSGLVARIAEADDAGEIASILITYTGAIDEPLAALGFGQDAALPGTLTIQPVL